MPARGAKKSENRASHDPPKKPAAPDPRQGEDEGIEILEVLGVDETTGSEDPSAAPAPPRPRPAAPQPAGAPAGDLSAALKEALAEKDKFYDLLLRKQAEFENFRKRTEREREDQRGAAAADLVKRLLPILDNLERALATSRESDGPLREGVVLIQQQFLDALRRERIVPMDTLGARFDPRLHEAVQVIDVEGFEQGVILEEVQKGYTVGERLLRPALVKVASGRTAGGTAGSGGGGMGTGTPGGMKA
jgi:molecular chaperone GrpE